MYNLLYTISMHAPLSELLSSTAKFEVLETLHYQPHPIPLRHIALCCRLPIRSVQVALDHLQRDKLVTRAKGKRWTMFTINRHSKYYPLLQTIFEAAMRFHLKERSNDFNRAAQASLKFNNDVTRLLSQARKSQHGHRITT